MTITYTCDRCGKTFDDADECALHEMEEERAELLASVGPDSLIFFDENYNRTPITEGTIETVSAVYVGNDKAMELLIELFSDGGYCTDGLAIGKTGYFKYDAFEERTDYWYDIGEIHTNLTKMLLAMENNA